MLVIPFSFLLFSLHIYYHVLSSCHGRIACVRKATQERVWISVAFPRVCGSACGSQRSEDSRMDKAASEERSGRRRKKGVIGKTQYCSQYIRGNGNSWKNLISKTEKNE